MAGICLTLLDEAGVPITSIIEDNNSGDNFDPEVIHDCLEEEFREATTGTTYNHIWVDIWVTGGVDGDALMQHIYECYRRSLCDYFIEKTVTIDLGAALSIDGALQKAVSAKSEVHLSTLLRKKFIESVLFILRKASELKSPTVYSMDVAIQTTPWCMDDLVRYLDVELRKIDPALRPTVAWTSLGDSVWGDNDNDTSSQSNWELYKGFKYRQRQKLQSNIRLVAISGLDEFVEKLGSVSDAFAYDRRPSTGSDALSSKSRSRRSSGDSVNTDASQKKLKVETHDHSRASSALSSLGGFGRSGPQLDSKKHCFMIMTLDVHRLSIYTYNWSESISQELFNGLLRVANRQEARNKLMTNILHQKMGLFHHTTPMKSIVEQFAVTSAQTASKSLSTNLRSSGTNYSGSTPLIQLTSPKPSKKNSRQYETTSKQDSTPSSRTPSGVRHNSNKNPPSINTGSVVASMLDLKDMIAFPTTAPSRESLKTQKLGDTTPCINNYMVEQEKHIDKILQKSSIRNAELDHALMDSITDSVADTIRSKDFDILRRHGQPFLEAFLRHAKIQSAHRKALKVYLKWRKRYGGSQASIDSTERLTVPEVSTIMRSSRMLHFCRTPLIFCDPEKDWSYLPEGSIGRTEVIAWFKNMGISLLSEYAKYLEGADMQSIDFAKPESGNCEDQSALRTSKFSLGKKLTVECPPTYLLRVFEGGSIICEARLTNVFVSVTLYTLHRQYGRLDYSRFRHESRTKKRSNFKKFEENSGNFKQMIHINSFVYDFQLNYIQKMLSDLSKVPADLDILSFVRRFSCINQQPSRYSKDRIIHGFYQFEVGNMNQSSFFENLFKNAPRHGLSNVMCSSGSSAVSVSSTDLSFVENCREVQSNWKYSLLMCPPIGDMADERSTDTDKPTSTNKIIIEYFILAVYQGRISPESMTKASWIKSKETPGSLSHLSFPEEGLTLSDIVSSARIRLDGIVSEVLLTTLSTAMQYKLNFFDIYVRLLLETKEFMIGANFILLILV
ncbi:hypothetical protein BD770DRAFT_179184 [Pilaira anomala]|nr:hypothetical protein BD770DRAFT_179184 [Pilaira anomala]